MTRIPAVARNTFRENIRDKVLYNLILFALIMIASSLALGQLTLGNEDKVILDLGLFSISVFGVLIAIFIGISLVHKEMERRTVHALLSKPFHRHEFILGKYAGLLLTLLVNVAVMTAGLELALLYVGRAGWGAHLRILPAVYLIFLSLALVTAIALFFSTFSTPALSALFTIFLWIAGHFGKDLLGFGEWTRSAAMKWICGAAYYVLPNFSNFTLIDSRNIIPNASCFRPIDYGAIAGTTFYCVVYCALVLSLAICIFRQRDFK
ncbi:MAG: ABC transporter permease subunit [Acidobacteria bacterium]|nr:ABC transporter permease subunit [Acidobacteriota bacterium]